MTARKQSKVNTKYKTKYRVRNWAEYEKGVRQRGNITFWFNEEAINQWNAKKLGKPGGQAKYSDLAIVTTLTLRALFRLPLRQTEGLVSSLVNLMGLHLEIPDHTTLSRRSGKVDVVHSKVNHDQPIHLMVDSTGLKIVGEGEWYSHKHKTSNRNRKWRKLHLGIDSQGYIVTSKLTKSNQSDLSVIPSLLKKLKTPVAEFTSDGGYDSHRVYQGLEKVGTTDIKIVIPPRQTAIPNPSASGAYQQRNLAVERIKEVGLNEWKKEVGANKQARVENAIGRFKKITGNQLSSRKFANQEKELEIKINLLNRMIDLGKPESYKVMD